MAPEFYNNLKYHSSWSRLLFQFIFDRRYSLYSRVERTEPDEPHTASQMVNHRAGNLDLSARPISF
jgi:sphingolipid delta-4 desaturase